MTEADAIALHTVDLNFAVAEKVDGWKWYVSDGTGNRCLCHPDKKVRQNWMRELAKGDEPLVCDWEMYRVCHIPKYCSDYNLALNIVRRAMEQAGPTAFGIALDRINIQDPPDVPRGPGRDPISNVYSRQLATPTNLCRAALLAVDPEWQKSIDGFLMTASRQRQKETEGPR